MKKLSEALPRTSHTHWGHGCQKCKYGLVNAPAILGAFPFYESRAVQAQEGLVEFCDCRAGHMYRQCLRKHYNALGWELRRLILDHIEIASMPTVHGVTAATEQEPA